MKRSVVRHEMSHLAVAKLLGQHVYHVTFTEKISWVGTYSNGNLFAKTAVALAPTVLGMKPSNIDRKSIVTEHVDSAEQFLKKNTAVIMFEISELEWKLRPFIGNNITIADPLGNPVAGNAIGR